MVSVGRGGRSRQTLGHGTVITGAVHGCAGRRDQAGLRRFQTHPIEYLGRRRDTPGEILERPRYPRADRRSPGEVIDEIRRAIVLRQLT